MQSKQTSSSHFSERPYFFKFKKISLQCYLFESNFRLQLSIIRPELNFLGSKEQDNVIVLMCVNLIPPRWMQDCTVVSHQPPTANRDFPVTKLVLPQGASLSVGGPGGCQVCFYLQIIPLHLKVGLQQHVVEDKQLNK